MDTPTQQHSGRRGGGMRVLRRRSRRSSSASHVNSASLVNPHAEEAIGCWRPTDMQLSWWRLLRAKGASSMPPSSVSTRTSTSLSSEEDVSGCWPTSTPSWLRVRLGTTEKVALFLAFMTLNAAKFVTQEFAYNGPANPFAGLALANLASLVFALFLSCSIEGCEALPKIFCWHAFWRFLVLAALFSTATFLNIRAYRTGLMGVIILLLGYTFLPCAVGLSYCVFRRSYGKLEWLATTMIVLTTVAFLLVRERCRLRDCKLLEQWSPERDVNALGIILVLSSVCISVIASLLSERLYKSLSRGLIRTCGCTHDHGLHVMKVHLDFSSVLLYGGLWMISLSKWGFVVSGEYQPKSSGSFFTLGRMALVLVTAGQGWLAALVTKRFDTVVRSLVQTLSTVLAVCVFDPLRHDMWRFSHRWLASLSMAGIVLISALVFQTGRINLQTIRRNLHLQTSEESPTEGLGWRDSLSSMLVLPCCAWKKEQEVLKPAAQSTEEGQAAQVTEQRGTAVRKVVVHCLSMLKYTSILLYVLADGFRTVLQSAALNQTQNTPAVFVLVINACGLILANGLTLSSNGFAGLRQSWNLKKVLRFLLCGFFFALTSTLQALAYASGISPALSMVIGKFYTPMLAILSKWILGKFFLSLEWLSIAILTLANIAYGSVQKMEAGGSSDVTHNCWTAMVPALCVLASAASACVNSLIMERLMTEDEKLPSGRSVPFHMQKVRLDAGTVLWSIAFLPLMGIVASGPGSEKFAFWKERPLTTECSELVTCEDGTLVTLDPSLDVSSCTCGGGFFVGWDNFSIYAALAVNVFYSWITGVIVVQFSSIYRAIADAFSLALVYYCLQPLFLGSNWNDTSLDFLAIVIPISAVTFSFSANEMQKVMQCCTESVVEKEQPCDSGTIGDTGPAGGRVSGSSSEDESDDSSGSHSEAQSVDGRADEIRNGVHGTQTAPRQSPVEEVGAWVAPALALENL